MDHSNFLYNVRELYGSRKIAVFLTRGVPVIGFINHYASNSDALFISSSATTRDTPNDIMIAADQIVMVKAINDV